MGNLQKYDRQDAVNKATQLFWEKGFHATSMRNLQEYIDMRPGSIYATFGSKEGLFKESLQCYTEASLKRLAIFSEQTNSPLEVLKSFVQSVVLNDSGKKPNEICMLVKTISELTEENTELLSESKRLLKVMEDAFAALLIKSQEQGELDTSKDPQRLARFIQMQLIGLRAYTRANSDAEVDELIDEAFTCLL